MLPQGAILFFNGGPMRWEINTSMHGSTGKPAAFMRIYQLKVYAYGHKCMLQLIPIDQIYVHAKI